MSSAIQYGFPTSLPWTEKLVSKLSQPTYRHAYMVEGVKTWIARQVRTLREQRDWSQDDLGRETGKPQSAISRVEDPDYGKLTLQTLFDLARAFDLPLLVQFVEWSDWLARMNDTSSESLQKASFSAEALTDIGTGQIGINEQFAELISSEFNQTYGQGTQIAYPHFFGGGSSNLNLLLGTGGVSGGGTQVSLTVNGVTVYGDYNFPLTDITFHSAEKDEENHWKDQIRWPRFGALMSAEIEHGR